MASSSCFPSVSSASSEMQIVVHKGEAEGRVGKLTLQDVDEQSSVTDWDRGDGHRNAEVTEAALDALVPLMLAMSDAVVVCNAQDLERRAWVRTELALAHVFAPGGQAPYFLDRQLGAPGNGSDFPTVATGVYRDERGRPQGSFAQSWSSPKGVLAGMAGGRRGRSCSPSPHASSDEESDSRSPQPPRARSLSPSPLAIGDEEDESNEAPFDGNKRVVAPFNGNQCCLLAGPIIPVLEDTDESDSGSDGGPVVDATAETCVPSVPPVPPEPLAGRCAANMPPDSGSASPVGHCVAETRCGVPIVLVSREWRLLNPLAWGEVAMGNEKRDRARLLRLVALCMADSPASLSGDLNRPPLDFDQTVVLAQRLEVEGTSGSGTSGDGLDGGSGDSSSSDDSEEQCGRTHAQNSAAALRSGALNPGSRLNDRALHSFIRGKQKMSDLQDQGLESYLTGRSGPSATDRKPGVPARPQSPASRLEQKFGIRPTTSSCTALARMHGSSDRNTENAFRSSFAANAWKAHPDAGQSGMRGAAASGLRTAAAGDMRGAPDVFSDVSVCGTVVSSLSAPNENGPRPEKLHEHFISSTVKLSRESRCVGQVHAWASAGPRGGFGAGMGGPDVKPSGGLAVTAKALEPHMGVAPEMRRVRGVAFDVAVCAADRRWEDGMGIGFTAQNPDTWPADRPVPRHASQMPRTWVGGYSGRWYFERRNELFKPCGKQLWVPGKLEVGDVVTCVAIATPVDVMRVLVNGKLVAEVSSAKSGLPDPDMTPLWGVVDLGGSCSRVALGKEVLRAELPASHPSPQGDDPRDGRQGEQEPHVAVTAPSGWLGRNVLNSTLKGRKNGRTQ